MAKLIINGGREFEIRDSVISIGRASDNSIPLADDANISRYHAEIERRGEDFCLIDLGSSNGTTINGAPVTRDYFLKSGDVIVLGGTSRLEFLTGSAAQSPHSNSEAAPVSGNDSESLSAIAAPPVAEKSSDTFAAAAAPPVSAEVKKSSKKFVLLAAIALVVLLAIVGIAAIVYFARKPAEKLCLATAEINSPDNGETISKETDVSLSVKNSDCIKRAVFVLDGKEFASAADQPFETKLDPADFGALADGQMHKLRIILEDAKGKPLPAQKEILIAFESLESAPEKDVAAETETAAAAATKTPVQNSANKKLSAADAQEMSRRLLKQFAGNRGYKFDPEFVEEVRRKTSEYLSEGYFERARKYRDLINTAFIQEQNLEPPLPYLLAMSRSKFNPQKQANEEGLWRMSNEFAAANSLNGMCGAETLGDVSQNCAAKAAALYLKAIMLNVFEGDTIFGIAAFGMTPQEAALWKSTLPADRTDFWKVLKSTKQREEVIRFFAAGIVAENPQVFNLKKDRPLSEIYKNLIAN